MRLTRNLRAIAVVIAASIIFGAAMIGTFFLYQLLDSVAVLAVACVLFAFFGVLEYWLVKKAGMVVASSALSVIVVFIAGVIFLGAGDGGHWLIVVSVSASLLVPVIVLVGIFPLAFASLGAFVTAFIYKKILRRTREENGGDTDKEIEQTENTEEATETVEEPKTERGLWKALIPVFAVYWVSCLLFVLFESLTLLILIPILCIFLGAWTRKRTQKLIAPISLHFCSTFLMTVLVYVPLNFIRSLIEGRGPRYFPPENLPELLVSGVLLALAVSAFYVFGLFFARMIKRLRSFNDDDAKMPFKIKRAARCILW